jgi:hypothetical protein
VNEREDSERVRHRKSGIKKLSKTARDKYIKTQRQEERRRKADR